MPKSIIGPAIGAGIGLLGSSGGGGSMSFALPSWLKTEWKDLTNRAVTESEKPFEAFTGEAVAPLSTDEQTAFQRLRDMMGGADPYFQGAQSTLSDVLSRATNGPSTGDITNLMNPYIQGVLDINKRKALEQFDDRIGGIRSNAINSGAFGGSGRYLQESKAYGDIDQLLSDMQVQGLSSAWDRAMSQYNTNTGLMGQTALSQAGLGAQQQGLGMQESSALAGAGATARGINQAQDTFDYGEFMRKIQDPQQKMQFLTNILGAASGGFAGAAYQPQQGPNPISGALGGAMVGNQLFNGQGGIFGNSGVNTNPFGFDFSSPTIGGGGGTGVVDNNFDFSFFKKGGLVKAYAEGGIVTGEPDFMDWTAAKLNGIEPGAPVSEEYAAAIAKGMMGKGDSYPLSLRAQVESLSNPVAKANLDYSGELEELRQRAIELEESGDIAAERQLQHDINMFSNNMQRNEAQFIRPRYMADQEEDRLVDEYWDLKTLHGPGFKKGGLVDCYNMGGKVKRYFTGGPVLGRSMGTGIMGGLTDALSSLWEHAITDEASLRLPPPLAYNSSGMGGDRPSAFLVEDPDLMGPAPGGISPETLNMLSPVDRARITQESRWDPNAIGSAGEIGLGQIKPPRL
jgi:hypothetical protein